jgi:ribosomal protein S18 acetylase RimI-like enzyme
VALEAWQHTYRAIFDQQYIENFINQNYAPEVTISMLPLVQSGTMFFHAAQHGSKLVGFCNIGIDHQAAELYRIYLLPAYIGQGIGHRLLAAGEEFLSAQEIYTYFCFVHKDNQIGQRFYSRSGFQRIPEKDSDEDWYLEKNILRAKTQTHPG